MSKYIKKTVLFKENERSAWIVKMLKEDGEKNNRQLGPQMAQILTEYIERKYGEYPPQS